MPSKDFINPPPGVKCIASLKDTIFSKALECDTESGYSFWVIRAGPDPNEVTSLCQSATCRTLIDNMRRVAPTECVMYDGYYLYADILNPVLKQCTLNGAWTITSPATGPGSPTMVPPAPQAAPAAESSSMGTGTTVGIISTAVLVLSILVWVVKTYRQHQRSKVPVAQPVNYNGMKDDGDDQA